MVFVLTLWRDSIESIVSLDHFSLRAFNLDLYLLNFSFILLFVLFMYLDSTRSRLNRFIKIHFRGFCELKILYVRDCITNDISCIFYDSKLYTFWNHYIKRNINQITGLVGVPKKMKGPLYYLGWLICKKSKTNSDCSLVILIFCFIDLDFVWFYIWLWIIFFKISDIKV